MAVKQKIFQYLSDPALVFISLAIIFGMFSALYVPQLSNNDENMHFLKSYNLAVGNFGLRDCSYPQEVNLKARAIYRDNYTTDFGDFVDFTDTTKASCGSAAGYTPIMHLPQAIGIAIAKILSPSAAAMVLGGRIGNLLFYCLALYGIIRFIKVGKWAYVVIGLFPIMVQTAGSLSADVMNNIVVMTVVAFTINLFYQKTSLSRYQFLILILLSSILALTKPTNLIFLLPLLALPSRLFTRSYTIKNLKIGSHIWKIVAGAITILASLLVMVAWYKLAAAPITPPSLDNPLSANPAHFIKILYNTYLNSSIGYGDIVLRGTLGEFVSFRYHFPSIMVFLNLSLLLIVLLYDDRHGLRQTRRQESIFSITSLITLLAFVIIVSYALYVTWAIQPYRLGPTAQYADGVQGRYFTASFALLIPVFITVRRWMRIDCTERFIAIFVWSGMVASLVYYTVQTCLYFS